MGELSKFKRLRETFPSYLTNISPDTSAKPQRGFFSGSVSSPFLVIVLCILSYVLCLSLMLFVFCYLSLVAFCLLSFGSVWLF